MVWKTTNWTVNLLQKTNYNDNIVIHNRFNFSFQAPTSYKYSETTYSSQNTSRPTPSPGPFPRPTTPSPGNQQTPKRLDDLMVDFPEAVSIVEDVFHISISFSQVPIDTPTDKYKIYFIVPTMFLFQRFPTQPDGITRRKVEVTHESSRAQNSAPNSFDNVTPVTPVKPTPIGGSRNVAGKLYLLNDFKNTYLLTMKIMRLRNLVFIGIAIS